MSTVLCKDHRFNDRGFNDRATNNDSYARAFPQRYRVRQICCPRFRFAAGLHDKPVIWVIAVRPPISPSEFVKEQSWIAPRLVSLHKTKNHISDTLIPNHGIQHAV